MTTFCASPAPIPKIALPFVILSRVIAERAIDEGCLLIASVTQVPNSTLRVIDPIAANMSHASFTTAFFH